MNELTTLLPEMTDIWQQTLNWQPTAGVQQEFQRLYELILEGNRQLNLTRITGADEFWEKHLWDSLRGLPPEAIASLPDDANVIDIGTGAGFPGIPVAIAYPRYRVTLLDATRKKIAFLQTLLTDLAIANVMTVCSRAEEIALQSQHRRSYDLALVRAVGTASICAGYALPLLKGGGLAVLYRGNWTDSETEELLEAVTELGGEIESIQQFTTPLTHSVRHCLYLRKVSTIPNSVQLKGR